MLTATRGTGPMLAAPAKTDDGPALVEEFQFSASGTQYRVLVVSLGEHEQIILAEPAGTGRHPRRWMPLSGDGREELAVTYIAEKLGMDPRSDDALNLTLLIGYALERPVLVFDPTQQFLERREPA